MSNRTKNLWNQLIMNNFHIDEEIEPEVKQLFIACLENNTTALRKLIDNGVNVNYKYKYGFTPILTAIKNVECNYDVIGMLLNNGVDINSVDDMGHNLLMYACNKCDFELVKFLISYNIDINYQNMKNKETALMIASNNYSYDITRFLLENGANPNIQNHIGNTAIMDLVIEAELGGYINVDIIKLLIEFHTNINIQNDDGITLPMLFIVLYRYWKTNYYNDNDNDNDNVNDNDIEVPHKICEIFKYTLECGYDLNIKDKDGNNLLTYAKSNTEFIRIILNYLNQH